MYIDVTSKQGTTEIVLEFEYQGVAYADSVVLDKEYSIPGGPQDLGWLPWVAPEAHTAIHAAMEAQGWEECDGYWVAPPPSVIESID